MNGIAELKEKAPDILKEWVDGRIDNLARTNPKLAPVSVYLRRGAHNYINRWSDRIGGILDEASMFLVGEDGKFDISTAFSDMLKMLSSMDEVPFGSGLMRGTIGKGAVRFEIPDGLLWSMIFGDTGAIKLTQDDFRALWNIISNRIS